VLGSSCQKHGTPQQRIFIITAIMLASWLFWQLAQRLETDAFIIFYSSVLNLCRFSR
jgi:hypothetical protein